MQTPMLLLSLFSLAFVPRQATSDAAARPGAEALLAAQRAGLGEPSALARLGAVRKRGTVEFEGYPGVGRFTETLAPTGESRSETLFEGSPPNLRATDRELYWMKGTGGIEIKQGFAASADVRLFALARHADWRDVYAVAELVGEGRVGDRACYELRMVPKSPKELGLAVDPSEQAPPADAWWLDRDTKELVRVEIDATVSSAGWQRLELDFSDWRTVGGVRFAHHTRMAFGTPEYRLVILIATESIELGVALDRALFQPDEQVLAELEKQRSGASRTDPGFTLQTSKEIHTATVRVRCKPEDLQQELATILPEVMTYLMRERLAPAGAPFSRYHALGAEIDLEAGIPVTSKVAGEGRVKPSILPGGEVVSGIHMGSYHELSRTHAALAEWISAEGLTPLGGPWEIYWTDPGLERDPAKWRTEVVQPVSRN